MINNETFEDKPEVTKASYSIRDAAIIDALNYIASDCTKRITISRFISKRNMVLGDSNEIYVANYKLKKVFWSRIFGKELVKSVEEHQDKPEYDSGLVRKYVGHIYLCMPKRLDKR